MRSDQVEPWEGELYMKIKKLGAMAIAGLMAATIALTGCSGQAASGSAAGSSKSETTKTAKVDGAKKYALVKDGTLTVGTSADYAPFEYKDDSGDYKGFDLELAAKIADKLGLKVAYVNNDFDSLVAGVASGTKYDVSLSAITETPERKKTVDFTDSYYMDDQAIVTKSDNGDITADNYSDKLNNADATLLVQSGSTAESFAKENFPKADVKAVKDATECFSMLQSDKGTAVVTNRSVAAQLTADQFKTCHVVKMISTGEEYSIAINKGNTKLKGDINKAIKDLTDDGTIDKLMAEYKIK